MRPNKTGVRHAFEQITDAYVALDTQWRYTYVNSKAGQMFGRSPEQLIGKHIWTEFPEGVGQPAQRCYERSLAEQRAFSIESYYPSYGRWFENRIYPSRDGLTIYFHDITDRKRREHMDAGQHAILEGIAAREPLADTLKKIVLLHEELNPGAICSVLLLDDAGERVLHGAAPSLPDAYNEAINGLPIGDGQGSCGTAAWSRQRVVAVDISTHPYWDAYKAMALGHGLRACWSTPVMSSKGRVIGTFAVYYRTCREPSEEELGNIDRMVPMASIAIESSKLFERLRERDCFFDLSAEIFCIFDPATERIVQANPTFTMVTGFSEEELCAHRYLHFVHPLDHIEAKEEVARLVHGGRVQNFAYRFLCADGGYRWLEWTSVTIPGGLAYAVAHDVTEQRRVEEKLAYAASHDPVTGLTNYLHFETTLGGMLTADPVSVLFIGLDRFQMVNDAIGHLGGDRVLQCVAQRLHGMLAAGQSIARFAGDKFVVAAAGLSHEGAFALADRLRAAIAAPIEGEGYRLLLTASVGISHYPESSDNPKELLRRAETAMRLVKREGRDGTQEFSFAQMQHLEDHRTLGSLLRDAIHNDEFALHYQPQCSADHHALIGFEALLRWNSRELGAIPPARFIPIAEALGLMPEIGEWVLWESCRQARTWLDAGYRGFTISVNVSAGQLQRAGLVDQVRDATLAHGISPSMLDLEITESSLMENVARTRRTLDELKALGTRLSLDDFGTGYSSLAYLKQFPIDKLKIDQSFVRGLPNDADDAAIAQTIIAMAHQLRMTVAAEGVETEAQSRFLTAIGCDELQGYHFGRPVPPGDADASFRK